MSDESIDAAWAEAQAALPNGWRLTVANADDPPGSWGAWVVSVAFYEGETDDDDHRAEGYGRTPAEALRAVAARLRERSA